MSLNKDGICRGTSMVVLLSDEKENLNILEGKVAQCFSFEKGSSTQDYPDSRMGAIALLRQTYYDATWYKQSTKREYNISLEAFNENQKYPSFKNPRYTANQRISPTKDTKCKFLNGAIA